MFSINPDIFYTVRDIRNPAELKIKGSRFITHIFHVLNKVQAEAKYVDIRKKYHNATHNCYAYRISEDEFRYSDDGEPPGTAGRQILQVLERKNLNQTLVIITRYFGGTKLGTGGLSRAYKDAVLAGLKNCKIEEKIRYFTLYLQTEYTYMSELLKLINKYNGIIVKSDYSETVNLNLQIPLRNFNEFQKEIENFLKNGITIIKDKNS